MVSIMTLDKGGEDVKVRGIGTRKKMTWLVSDYIICVK